jgi:hypothetical protein
MCKEGHCPTDPAIKEKDKRERDREREGEREKERERERETKTDQTAIEENLDMQAHL